MAKKEFLMVYPTVHSPAALNGIVEHITFYNPANGYCVLRLKSSAFNDCVTVVGSLPEIKIGETLECSGQWVTHPIFGSQFQAKEVCIAVPSSIDNIQKYLSSGVIRGIGEASAQKLISAFGDKVFEAFEHKRSKIKKILKISNKKLTRIMTSWQRAKVHREAFLFLQSLGFGAVRAAKIYKLYGADTIHKVKSNPYQLELDIEGIGFKLADEAAQKLGVPSDSLQRVQAGMRHVLKENSFNGHCAMRTCDLRQEARKLLSVGLNVVDEALSLELQQARIILDVIEETEVCYLARHYHHEVGTAKHFKRLLVSHKPVNHQPIDLIIEEFEKEKGFKLDAKQIEAVKNALGAKISIITGGPGTGKTTITQCLIKAVVNNHQEARIMLCAPTGRAAKRLAETTGLEAKTIHRLLEYRVVGQDRQFFYREGNPLQADWIIVDEVSMIDISLIHHLVKAVPDHARLVFIGDVDQLPSIGPGSVLKDLIVSGTVPVTRLNVIQRQAEQSRIIANAHLVNTGQIPSVVPQDFSAQCDFYFIEATEPSVIKDLLLEIVCQVIPEHFKLDAKSEVQVLSPMHRSETGVKALNQALQHCLNPHPRDKVFNGESYFSEGDKVIQTKNNYDKGIFNGDIGFIQSINKKESLLEVLFAGTELMNVYYKFNELEQLSLAYATTIHKAQGSEYPAIVMPLSTQHTIMLQKNLIYTAITRGRRLVILIGQQEALRIVVRNNNTTRRLTKLAARMCSMV